MSKGSTKGSTSSYEVAKYSFSGADAKGYFVVPGKSTRGVDLLNIESLSTISVQAYEPIGRARALGFRGVRGFAHSVREIAGTIVMTVVNDHPLRPLMNYNLAGVKRSKDKGKGFGAADGDVDILAAGLGATLESTTKIGTLLGDFGIFLDYVSEYPKGAFEDGRDAPNFKMMKDFNSSDSISQAEADRRSGTEYSTNVYRDMFSDKYVKLHEEYNKGSDKSYAGAFDHWGDDYMAMNMELSGGTVLEKSRFGEDGNFIVDSEQLDYFNRSLKENPGFLKKKYRDDIDKIISQHRIHNQSYTSNITRRETERAGLYIEGIRIISEGIVTSVNDMVTEMTFQFIAKDLKTISKLNNFKHPALRQDELVKILSNPNHVPVQLQKEYDALKNTGHHSFKMTHEVGENGTVSTTFLTETGFEFKPTTKKQRRKMYKK